MLHKNKAKSILRTGAFVSVFLAMVGCGGTAPKTTPAKSANALGKADAKCASPSSCPNTRLIVDASGLNGATVDSTGLNGATLTAPVGQRTVWSFNGTTENAAQREIYFYLMYEPQGATIQGQSSTAVDVIWTPTQVGLGSQPIKVLARDVTRCKMLEGKANAQSCTNMTKKMTKYESEHTFNYEVVDGYDMIDPAFTSTQPAMQGSNSGLAGCAGGAIPGILSGMMGGGGMMQGVMGCINGMVGGLGTVGGATQPLGGLFGGAQQQQPIGQPVYYP